MAGHGGARRRRAIAAAARVERAQVALENDVLRAIIADLVRVRAATLEVIASSPKDWQIVHAKGVLAELDRQLVAWERVAATALSGAVPAAADLGAQSIIDPLIAAGSTLTTMPVIPQSIIATAYATLPDLIAGVRSEIIAKVGTILRMAVLGQKTPLEAMAEVGRIVGPTARGPFRNAALRSEFIVRTELGRISQQSAYATGLDLAGYGANAGLVSEWLTAGDTRVRHTHAAANGQRVPIGSDFTVGGHATRYPHDPRLPAKESVGCRCRILEVDPAWDEA